MPEQALGCALPSFRRVPLGSRGPDGWRWPCWGGRHGSPCGFRVAQPPSPLAVPATEGDLPSSLLCGGHLGDKACRTARAHRSASSPAAAGSGKVERLFLGRVLLSEALRIAARAEGAAPASSPPAAGSKGRRHPGGQRLPRPRAPPAAGAAKAGAELPAGAAPAPSPPCPGAYFQFLSNALQEQRAVTTQPLLLAYKSHAGAPTKVASPFPPLAPVRPAS